MPRQYVDLDLAIEADGGEYVARVVDSPAGQATHRFELPFSSVGLENFILKLGHNRGVTRRANSPRLSTAREFGAALYQAVFDGEVEVSFRRSLDQALASEKGLRIRLRIAGAPALAEIPWEYMYAEGLGRFIVMSSDTPLVRYLDLPTGVTPLAVEPPLRVLVMVASPTDLTPLDVDREVELLHQATADLTAAGVLDFDIVPHASLSSLQHQLRVAQYHVFHFIGHGVYDEKEDDGLLMLEDDDGRSRAVSGLDLGVLLHDHHSLRLAVLNACEGARGSIENPLGGVAQSLIRQGLPAAVAMQFEISDDAALVFAHEFYLAIGDGYPIDAATVEARKAIFASGNDVEWGTPVLHLRASDARVFDLQSKAPDEARPSTEREEATRALTERRFAAAVPLWEAIVAAAPGDEAATVMLKRARDGLEASGKYDAVRRQLAAGVFAGALEMLDQVNELDAEHGDPDDLRSTAEHLAAESAAARAEEEARRDDEARQEEEARRQEEHARRLAAGDTPVPKVPVQEPAPKARTWLAMAAGGALVLVALVVGVMVLAALLDDTAGGDVSIPFTVAETLGNGGEELPPGVVGVVPAAGIVPDGDISDWPGNAQLVDSNNSVHPEPGAAPGVRAEWVAAYDNSALYVLVGVEDTSVDIAPLGQPDQWFRGDSVHFEFGADPTGAASLRQGDVHVMLVPVDPSTFEALGSVNPAANGQFVSGAAQPLIQAVAVWDPTGYLIEARIPWQVLGVGNPTPGLVAGMNFNVSDGDSSGGLEEMVSSNPERTGANQARPETWNSIVLLDG